MLNKDILDSLGEGVITVDKDFRVTFFNRAAEMITGYKRDEVSGRLCKLVFDCELCETKCPIGLVLETNQNIYDFSSNILLKDGSRKSIKLNAAILKNGDGIPTGGVISFRDLSEIEAIKEDRKSMTTFYGIIGQGGTSVGTKTAPSYGNTYMGKFENDFVYVYPTQSLCWKMYINDCFLIWMGTEDSLNAFLKYLNTGDPNIKFTFEKSQHSVNFLDTTVNLETHLLKTDLVCKPTDSHN